MPSTLFNLVLELPGSSVRYYQLATDAITIGRGEQNAIIVEEESVSGSHLELARKGEAFTVKDLGSTNGTRLNGESIGKEARELRDGDLLTIGASVKARLVRVIEVTGKQEKPKAESESGTVTRRLKKSPSRPAINPVAAAVARAAKDADRR